MKKRYTLLATAALLALAMVVPVGGQTLADQVLLLLSRANTWTAAQTFGDLTITGTCTGCGGAGGGTVTSIAQSLDAPLDTVISLSGSPIVGSGTLALTLDTQTDHFALIGPLSGGPTAPTFRALVDDDIPDTITIAGTNTVTWASIDQTGSTLADIATASAADITSGKLALARLTTGTAGLPLIGGATDPIYQALDLTTAANISGELAAANFPTLTGDITTAGGALATTLSSTGVSANTYGSTALIPAFTVDAKGRITAASEAAVATAAMLSTTYCSDCTASGPTRGDLMYVPVGGSWDDLAVGTAGQFLRTDGTDIAWGVDGSALTTLNGSNVSSGTVAIARGGTGGSAAATAGGVVYGAAGVYAVTAAGTASQCLLSNGASAPSWGACATLAAHDMLSASHSDTNASAVTRGSIILANSTPEYSELAIGSAGTFLRSDGTDGSWSTDGSGLTALNGSNISSGTISTAVLPTIAVTKGGTGLTTLTTGDILTASSASAMAQITAVASGQVLVSAGTSTQPVWSAGPSLTSVTLAGGLLTLDVDGVIAADDVTPDVSGGNLHTTSANTGATAITDLDSPGVGSIVCLVGGSATNSSTLADSGNFNLTAAMTLGLDDNICLLVQADNDYIEVSRSDN